MDATMPDAASARTARIARNMESVRIGDDDYAVDWAGGEALDEIGRLIQQGLGHAGLATTVSACDAGFALPADISDPGAGRVYAGVCTLSLEGVVQRALVCHAPATGVIAQETATEAFGTLWERKRLIEFTLRTCYRD